MRKPSAAALSPSPVSSAVSPAPWGSDFGGNRTDSSLSVLLTRHWARPARTPSLSQDAGLPSFSSRTTTPRADSPTGRELAREKASGPRAASERGSLPGELSGTTQLYN